MSTPTSTEIIRALDIESGDVVWVPRGGSSRAFLLPAEVAQQLGAPARVERVDASEQSAMPPAQGQVALWTSSGFFRFARESRVVRLKRERA